MGQTVSSLYQSYSPCAVPQYRLLICGISAAGKTSVLYRLALPEKEEIIVTIPTIGFNVERFRADAAELTAWDLGGRDKTRALWKHYYEGTDAIVFVVDSNDPAMMEANRDEFYRITNEKELRGFPVLLLCNKQDLPGAMTPEEIVEFLGLDENGNMSERPILIQGCSAKTNAGIDDGINQLADCLMELNKSSKRGTKSTKGLLDDDSIQTSDASTSSTISSSEVSALSSKENQTLRNFAAVQKSTQCPFAKAAKLWGGLTSSSSSSSSADEIITIEEQAASHIPYLVDFCEMVAQDKPLDGFCIEIDDEVARKGSPEEFGQCVRRMLSCISAQDPSGGNVMKAKYIGRPGWRFRFHSIDFFVATFAPCYPETSSRYSFGSDKAFILLQPETSFLRHKLPADLPETDWEHPRNIREKTRVAFKKAGRPYHIPETTSYPMVEHIVKPICDDGKNVVRWWVPSKQDSGIGEITTAIHQYL